MKKIIISVFFIIGACLCAGVCFGEEQVENTGESTVEHQTYFEEGYKFFQEKEYELAIPYFHKYLQNISPDESNYEWASFFLGVSLKKVGLSHASVDVLAHLVMRKPNPKIVIYALELFEDISRTIPFDRDLIIREVASSQEFGFVDGKMADFIHYYQGLYDVEHGFVDWGNEQFRTSKSPDRTVADRGSARGHGLHGPI